MVKQNRNCPNNHGAMQQVKAEETHIFRGVEIAFSVEKYICGKCDVAIASIEQASNNQKRLAEAYRRKVGLLTGEEISQERKKIRLTQQGLADRAGVGVASIKRWEAGIIQTKSMDSLLRMVFGLDLQRPCFDGGRELSLPRVKLVLQRFESLLNRKLLKKNDRMLYAAKYLWYADQACFRETGVGMTGATYAALPLGPQLNNYKDLVENIQKADETTAEPLTPVEIDIIDRIAQAFPKNQDVYRAAHREEIWQKMPAGKLMDYNDAIDLHEI